MGAQVVLCDGFEVVPSPVMNHLLLFGNDQNGSNYDESTIATEEERNCFSGDSSPEGVAEEEWPGAKSLSFYIVKQPFYDDPEIKAKIDNADLEIYQCNKLRIDISNAQKFERAEASSLSAQVESLISNWEGYRVVFEAKMREFDTLEESLQNLWCSSSDQLCFSKEELDHLIYRARYHIEHGSNGLEDENWVVKDTEKPDWVVLSEDSLAEKEASIHRVKSMAVELSEVKKELDAVTWHINHLNDKKEKSEKNIKVLDVEMAHVLEHRDRSFERIRMLRLQRDKGNSAYFHSFAVMRKAKNLAASANVKELEVFASSEVDKFMDKWNNNKAFRDDYVKRVSVSLCERQLSRDGRIRDPPPVQVVRETQVPFKTLKGVEEIHKVNREDSSSSSSSSSNSSQGGNVITDKQKKEGQKEATNFNRSSAEESDVIDLEFPLYEKPKKEEEEVDEETLKKREREEQIEKARLAMERKRKLQEKTAAKAAVRAQKEAEKKLKESEKKAKKKTATNSSPPLELDQSREVNELEKVKNSPVSGKEKHQKERSFFPKQRSFRYKHRGRGTEALPKAIINRRKAQKYWVWGLSSAALAFVVVLVVLLLR